MDRLIRLVELGILHKYMYHPISADLPKGVLQAINFDGIKSRIEQPITDLFILKSTYVNPPLLDVDYHLITLEEEEACKAYLKKRWEEIVNKKMEMDFMLQGRERMAIIAAVPPDRTLDDIETGAVALGSY